MKSSTVPELTPFKLKRGKPASVATPSTRAKHKSLDERDREIANSGRFRKSLYDYDVENAAVARVTAV
jgi:hypothetical protein